MNGDASQEVEDVFVRRHNGILGESALRDLTFLALTPDTYPTVHNASDVTSFTSTRLPA